MKDREVHQRAKGFRVQGLRGLGVRGLGAKLKAMKKKKQSKIKTQAEGDEMETDAMPSLAPKPPPCPRLDCLPGPYAKCPRCAAKSARWAWFWSKPRGKYNVRFSCGGKTRACIPAITSSLGREMTACDCVAGRAMTACDWLATGHRMACVLSRQSARNR